jgi:hypothetical protein
MIDPDEQIANTYKLLAGEDLTNDLSGIANDGSRDKTHINGNKVNLSVTVLTSLGGGHIDDLARAAYAGW